MNQQRRSALKILAGLCGSAALPNLAWSQPKNYPNGPINVVVPYGAGGSTDVFAREIASDLGSRYNGKFFVENKAGAAGNIGTRFVSAAPADGNTLLYTTATPFSINPFIYRSLPYDPDNGFAPIALTVALPLVLVVSKELGVNTMEEFVAYLHKHEKTCSYSSYGVGTSSHISAAILMKKIGTPDVLHVPYKDAKAIPDLAANRNTFHCDAWSTVSPLVKADKLVVLGVCGRDRLPWVPDVPTITSVIKQDYDMSTWHGMFAPKSTPAEILDFLNEEIKITMAKEKVRQAAAAQGFPPYAYLTRKEVEAFVLADKARWKGFVQDAGVEPM
jgi:tripartite-type tricarboxylate transporter receptor subunit TctC